MATTTLKVKITFIKISTLDLPEVAESHFSPNPRSPCEETIAISEFYAKKSSACWNVKKGIAMFSKITSQIDKMLRVITYDLLKFSEENTIGQKERFVIHFYRIILIDKGEYLKNLKVLLIVYVISTLCSTKIRNKPIAVSQLLVPTLIIITQ